MHITSLFHVVKDPFLQIGHGIERVGDILILLNIANDLSCFESFREVDELSILDNRGYSVLDKG